MKPMLEFSSMPRVPAQVLGGLGRDLQALGSAPPCRTPRAWPGRPRWRTRSDQGVVLGFSLMVWMRLRMKRTPSCLAFS